MGLDKATFRQRSISAVLFVIVMLSAIIYSSWSFLVLLALILYMCIREYTFLLENIYKGSFLRKDKFAFIIASFCAFIFIALFPIKNCSFTYSWYEMPALFYFLGALIGMVFMLLMSKDKKAKILLTGIGYFVIPLALLYHLRLQSLMIPLFLIFTIWINDTMAYVGGSFFGKTPLAPTISPKKTREGTAIGVLFALLFGIVWGIQFTQYSILDFMILAIIGSVIGTFGDLVESRIKRWAGVKDSGQMMPGHGGALDRFDSLIFATSFAFLYAFLFMDCAPWELIK